MGQWNILYAWVIINSGLQIMMTQTSKMKRGKWDVWYSNTVQTLQWHMYHIVNYAHTKPCTHTHSCIGIIPGNFQKNNLRNGVLLACLKSSMIEGATPTELKCWEEVAGQKGLVWHYQQATVSTAPLLPITQPSVLLPSCSHQYCCQRGGMHAESEFASIM